MTRIALRQYRMEFALIALILAALAAYLVPTGLDRFAEFEDSGLKACLDSQQPCGELRDRFTNSYNGPGQIVGWFHFIPAIAGVLLAAPIVAELEQRTYRLAWTQSITRERWLLTKLAVGIAGVFVFALVFTATLTWWHTPLDRTATLIGRDLGQSYGFEGVVPFCYTLFAFSLAVAAGAVSRKMLVGMPVALAVFVAVRLTLDALFRGLSSEVAFEATDGGLGRTEGTRDMDRFWTVQVTEGLIFVGASVVLLGLTYWLVKRRL